MAADKKTIPVSITTSIPAATRQEIKARGLQYNALLLAGFQAAVAGAPWEESMKGVDQRVSDLRQYLGVLERYLKALEARMDRFSVLEVQLKEVQGQVRLLQFQGKREQKGEHA